MAIWEGHGCYLGTICNYVGQHLDNLGVILGELGGNWGPFWGLNFEASKHTNVVDGNAGARVSSLRIKRVVFSIVLEMDSLWTIETAHHMEMLKSFSHYTCAAKLFSGNAVVRKQVIDDSKNITTP